jgi:hypothetical protein
VSAACRLETTITHGKSADAVWTLAPLAFWAAAEMTCGFFIVSLPCIPKILKDTGAGVKIKRALGMSTSSGNYNSASAAKRTWESKSAGSASNHGGLAPGTASNAYYRLDPLKPSESTEYLHKHEAGITRTTRISVTQEGDGRDMWP